MGRYSGDWWIGLRARGGIAGVDYYWDNDALITYTHWDRNQPGILLAWRDKTRAHLRLSVLIDSLCSLDNHAGSCVTMTTTPLAGFWKNKECEESFPFVCEAPRNGVAPPTRPPTPPPAAGCESGWTAEPHFRNCYRVRILRSPVYSWKNAFLPVCGVLVLWGFWFLVMLAEACGQTLVTLKKLHNDLLISCSEMLHSNCEEEGYTHSLTCDTVFVFFGVVVVHCRICTEEELAGGPRRLPCPWGRSGQHP